MDNQKYPGGIRARGEEGGYVPTRPYTVSTSSTLPLTKGSPFYVSAGLALASTTSGSVTGTVEGCYAPDGTPVNIIPATPAAGYTIIGSYKRGQEYYATVDSTQYAGDASNGTKCLNTSTEGATVADNDNVSTRQLTGSHGDAYQFLILRKSDRFFNTAAVANTEVICKIQDGELAGASKYAIG